MKVKVTYSVPISGAQTRTIAIDDSQLSSFLNKLPRHTHYRVWQHYDDHEQRSKGLQQLSSAWQQWKAEYVEPIKSVAQDVTAGKDPLTAISEQTVSSLKNVPSLIADHFLGMRDLVLGIGNIIGSIFKSHTIMKGVSL